MARRLSVSKFLDSFAMALQHWGHTKAPSRIAEMSGLSSTALVAPAGTTSLEWSDLALMARTGPDGVPDVC